MYARHFLNRRCSALRHKQYHASSGSRAKAAYSNPPLWIFVPIDEMDLVFEVTPHQTR